MKCNNEITLKNIYLSNAWNAVSYINSKCIKNTNTNVDVKI